MTFNNQLQYSVIMTIVPRITCANLRNRPGSVTAIGFKGQRNNNRGGYSPELPPLSTHAFNCRRAQLRTEAWFRGSTSNPEEGGSDHVILPDPVLLPVESLSSYSGGITC